MKFASDMAYTGAEGGRLIGFFDGTWKMVKIPFKPYCFVRVVDYLGAEEVFSKYHVSSCELSTVKSGDSVLKIEADDPRAIGSLRKKCSELGIETYEADIPYVRRVVTDRVFEFDVKLSNVMFIDVELDDSKGFKKYGEMPFLSVAYSIGGGSVNWLHVSDYEKEADFLSDIVDTIVTCGVTVLVGWNIGFDYKHLESRFRRLGPWSRFGSYFTASAFDLMFKYDLRNAYRNFVKGLVRYSLDEVSRYEGLGGKAERRGRVAELSKDELREYNVRDVELLVEINKRYGFLEKDLYLANEVSVPLQYHRANLLGDILILRRLRELGYVAPNSVKREKKGYAGAMILEPKAGLHERVAYCDVVSLYPTAVICENVDIAGFSGEVVPYLVAYFFKRKEEEGEKGNKVGRDAYKTLANSLYGLFGHQYFRFFDESNALKVTETGRKVLSRMIGAVESLGLQVLYADTDSVFIKADGIENVEPVVDYINEVIHPYKVKFEGTFDKIVFYGREGGGVKKRYIGKMGDRWVFRGVEIRRGDWCELSKKVLLDVVKMIFSGSSKADIDEYLRKTKLSLYRGELDDMLVITKSVRDEKDYKVKPKHFLLWSQAVATGRLPEDSTEVSYYYRAGGDIGLWSPGVKDFDYKEYWDKQVVKPVERLLESVYGSKSRVRRLDEF